MGHMSAPESTIEAGAVRSRWTCVSAGSLLSSEAGSSVEGHVVVADLSWMARGGGAGSSASGHVAAPETS
jgi:hypothetical protein